MAAILAARLGSIRSSLNAFKQDDWKKGFISACESKHSSLVEQWKTDWIKLCSGKRLIDDIYREYTARLSKFDFKRRLAKRMKDDQTEDWTLVKIKLRDALGG